MSFVFDRLQGLEHVRHINLSSPQAIYMALRVQYKADNSIPAVIQLKKVELIFRDTTDVDNNEHFMTKYFAHVQTIQFSCDEDIGLNPSFPLQNTQAKTQPLHQLQNYRKMWTDLHEEIHISNGPHFWDIYKDGHLEGFREDLVGLVHYENPDIEEAWGGNTKVCDYGTIAEGHLPL